MTEALLSRPESTAGASACFKSYDIRGIVGRELSYDLARQIGNALAHVLDTKAVVVGRDCRLTSPALAAAVKGGLTACGSDVIDIGVAGTEEVYFATEHYGADAGVAVTASHNPASHNGMKFVGPGSRPLAHDEFERIRETVQNGSAGGQTARTGTVTQATALEAYAASLVNDVGKIAPLRLLVDAGNGVAGPAFDAVIQALAERGAALDVKRQNHKPDGRFLNGVPNPLLPHRRAMTSQAVRDAEADIGIAWDGDFDRCFFFDRFGAFVDGAYVSALIAEQSLAARPGQTVLHDARVVWPMQHAARSVGSFSRVARTGHVHMKRAMAETGATYGGELSGHHYFRSFMGCDSGMLPWLRVVSLLSERQAPLDQLVGKYREGIPVSGELNYRSSDPKRAMSMVKEHFALEVKVLDEFDGVSLSFEGWRFNLRTSSTEPLIRLNMEALRDRKLLSDRLARVDDLLRGVGQCERVT